MILESKLVWEYFRCIRHGFFVDVGANHPVQGSQTYFLESQGWHGVLIEPNPALCHELRRQRPGSQVIETAICAPADIGVADLHLGNDSTAGHSTIRPRPGILTADRVSVRMQTLSSVLLDKQPVDFLSLDIEGMELDALRGFDLDRWQPRLILIEDFFLNHDKHNYLRSHGYKLIRRTGYNNWYVPQAARGSCWHDCTAHELFRLGRKFWFTPIYETLRQKV